MPYEGSGQPVAVILGAADSTVQVTTTDARTTYRDRVSTKKNGYGIELAAVAPSNDLAMTVTDAFQQELAARGFRIAPGGTTVRVQIVRFYNDFKNGFFSGDAVATVAFNVQVASPRTSLSFSKYYEGTGTEANILIGGGDNARAALIKAFRAGVNSALADDDFIRALVAAGAQRPAS